MAADDPLFNLDVVRDFIIDNGGRVKNHQLVTHFKTFLNDPRRKAANRGKFKSFVNTLSSIKLDEGGEKVLVLKRKYRDHSDFSSSSAAAHMPKLDAPKKKLQDSFQVRDPSPPPEDNTNIGAAAAAEDAEEELAEDEEVLAGAPASAQRMSTWDVTAAAAEACVEEVEEEMSLLDEIQERLAANNAGITEFEESEVIEKIPEEPKAKTPESEPVEEEKEEVIAAYPDEPVLASAPDDVIAPPAPAPAAEPPREPSPAAEPPREPSPAAEAPREPSPAPEAPVEKVLDSVDLMPEQEKAASVSSDSSREQSVNRDVECEPLNQSNCSVREYTKQLNKAASHSQSDLLAGGPVQKRPHKGSQDREEEHENISLDATEREWMVTSSGADYLKIHKLLNKHPRLATRKDFITGMTALHWAAKHGNVDVVKLICSHKDVDVNARSNGGYTPLHLAAMQSHEAVIESLVQTYHADLNVRDHSGRKAKQYLRNSASSRAQQLLQTSRLKHRGDKPGLGSHSAGGTASSSTGGRGGSAGAGGAVPPFRRVGSYSSKIRSAGHFGIHASPAVRSSWMDGMNDGPALVGRRGSDRSESPSPASSPSGRRRASAPPTEGPKADTALMPPPQGIPLASSQRRMQPRHRDNTKENHSDSEAPRSRSRSPRSMVSSSDPNLAATYASARPAAPASDAQMYQSAV